MAEHRFCKDCRFAHRGLLDMMLGNWQWAKCHHRTIGYKRQTDFVTGKTSGGFWFCSSNRLLSQDCGAVGKYWEPRP